MSISKRAIPSRKMAVALFAAVGVVGSIFVGPTAFASIDECAVGVTCLWDYSNYDTYIGSRPPGGGVRNVSSGANDRTASWANRSAGDAAWYTDANAGGRCFNMLSHTRNPELAFLDRDTLSSWKTNGNC